MALPAELLSVECIPFFYHLPCHLLSVCLFTHSSPPLNKSRVIRNPPPGLLPPGGALRVKGEGPAQIRAKNLFSIRGNRDPLSRAVFSVFPLASRAIIRRSLPDGDMPDLGAAFQAWFSFAAVGSEVILEIPSAVDPVDAGPVLRDPRPQRGADPAPQSGRLFPAQGVAAAQRMQSRAVQRLVGVNVADPGDEGLVQ